MAGGETVDPVTIIWWVVLLAAFFFILVWPQQRQQRQRKQVLSQLVVGDQVVTIGGIHGRIRSLDEQIMMLEIAPELEITMERSAVAYSVRTEPAEG